MSSPKSDRPLGRVGARLLGALLLSAAVTGCGRAEPPAAPAQAPTVAPIFSSAPTPTPMERPTTAPSATPSPAPTRRAGATPPIAPTSIAEQFTLVPIFTDILAPGWSFKATSGVRYDGDSTAAAFSGKESLSGRGVQPWGTLVLSVERSAPRTYQREDVLGVRFMVSGGDKPLPMDGLVVTLYGSNRQPYWVPGDVSATLPEGRVFGDAPLFPETRLYFLGLNRDLEPGEWAEVVVWLDDHPYPEFQYVTGLIIKNDERFLNTFYIDDVELIMAR